MDSGGRGVKWARLDMFAIYPTHLSRSRIHLDPIPDVMRTISAGRMPSSPNRGLSPYSKPLFWCANPDEETTDWRAVHGRTAHTVRRAGRALALPDPYRSLPSPDARRTQGCVQSEALDESHQHLALDSRELRVALFRGSCFAPVPQHRLFDAAGAPIVQESQPAVDRAR